MVMYSIFTGGGCDTVAMDAVGRGTPLQRCSAVLGSTIVTSTKITWVRSPVEGALENERADISIGRSQ